MVETELLYPDFTWSVYRRLLSALAARWQITRLDGAVERSRGALILRHDVDFSPALALPMAELESEQGVCATYFVALHLHYNPHTPLHARALRRIVALGHEIGFHYDGAVYNDAGSRAQQQALLQQHIAALRDICETDVRSIARHNPSTATGDDPFAVDVPYINAYDPRFFQDTVYLSDSCRAWRNGGLGACWAEPPPPRIYLLTHPEIWGDEAAVARLDFLPRLRQQVLQEQSDFMAEVEMIWQNHSGGLEHDRRMSDGVERRVIQ